MLNSNNKVLIVIVAFGVAILIIPRILPKIISILINPAVDWGMTHIPGFTANNMMAVAVMLFGTLFMLVGIKFLREDIPDQADCVPVNSTVVSVAKNRRGLNVPIIQYVFGGQTYTRKINYATSTSIKVGSVIAILVHSKHPGGGIIKNDYMFVLSKYIFLVAGVAFFLMGIFIYLVSK